MRVEIHRGEKARTRLRSPEFEAEWRALSDRTPWLSTFQSPAFCLPWYRAYADRFEPVMALAEENGRLRGLMPLAHDGERLCHAGDHQCEYRGWLADPELADRFALEAIPALLELESSGRWIWKRLAPGAPTGWIDELGARVGISRTSAEVPLMDVLDEEFMESKSRGRLRSHRNHFGRRGLRYERVEEPARAVEVLARLATWCDLRQGAAHDVLPFAGDSCKLDFHRRLLEHRDMFWLSALWLDEGLLAAHLGPFDGDELAMGIQAYDPREGRRSPGAILMLEMARDLAEAGGRTLDLTPGGDPWKERWASRHRSVESLELRRGRLASTLVDTGRSLEKGARSLLERLGADPSRVREQMSVIAGGLGRKTSTPLLGELNHALWAESRGVSAIRIPSQPRPDRFDGLLVDAAARLDPEAGCDLLSQASRCLAEGWRPWCLVEEERLAALAWTPPDEGWIDLEDLDAVRCRRDQPQEQAVRLPEDALLIRVDAPVEATPRAIEALVSALLDEIRPEGPIWLLIDGSLAETSPLLAAATIGRDERTGSDPH